MRRRAEICANAEVGKGAGNASKIGRPQND
jgi:hypothetical protein